MSGLTERNLGLVTTDTVGLVVTVGLVFTDNRGLVFTDNLGLCTGVPSGLSVYIPALGLLLAESEPLGLVTTDTVGLVLGVCMPSSMAKELEDGDKRLGLLDGVSRCCSGVRSRRWRHISV